MTREDRFELGIWEHSKSDLLTDLSLFLFFCFRPPDFGLDPLAGELIWEWGEVKENRVLILGKGPKYPIRTSFSTCSRNFGPGVLGCSTATDSMC